MVFALPCQVFYKVKKSIWRGIDFLKWYLRASAERNGRIRAYSRTGPVAVALRTYVHFPSKGLVSSCSHGDTEGGLLGSSNTTFLSAV